MSQVNTKIGTDNHPAYFRNHFKSFLKEIEGCIPLCSNCHRIRHNKHNCKQRENLPG